MNRHYSRETYLDIVNKIRDTIPGVTISTDIIVGFPGESESDFDDTLDMVEKCAFDSSFTFLFSPRSGTKAAEMLDQIPREIQSERFDRLLKASYPIIEAKSRTYIGTNESVIVEGTSRNNTDILSGRTKCNKLVNFSGNAQIGETVSVKITDAKTFYLYGQQNI
jgi:tRNA-2-methylthio-N6-dimethylallyladenosine synthase